MDKREKLLKIISELMGVLNTKNISPDEAKSVVSMLERAVNESISNVKDLATKKF